jgi:hypothetical protein
MSDLNDIPIPSITEMTQDQAIDYLRQIRLARRTPQKPSISYTKKKESKAPTKLSQDQAAELLKLLEETL